VSTNTTNSLALDRPLSAEDLAYVRTLSIACKRHRRRRCSPTPSGDFRNDPLDLLAKHYDIMLYVANWGSKQLRSASRRGHRPAGAPSLPLCIEEIEVSTVGQHVILNIAFLEGEPLGLDRGRGILAGLPRCATTSCAAICARSTWPGSPRPRANLGRAGARRRGSLG